MKNIIIGIVLGVLGCVSISYAHARTKPDFQVSETIVVYKISDGNTKCYIAEMLSMTWTPPSISCVRVTN